MRERWQRCTPRQREALTWLALAAPVLVLLWPLWLAGRAPMPDYLPFFAPWSHLGRATTAWNPLWYDALGQYWPWRCLLTDGLRSGALPLWNPYQFDGYSFVANGQSALFYPLNWLCFGLFGVVNGFRLTAMGHLWLAGVGTYRLLRELGASRRAAVVSGVCFELSGFLVLWLPLPTLLSSAAWLPWACALLERSRRRRDGRWAVLAGAAVGLSALAGHPQVFYYVGLAAGLVAVVRVPARYWVGFGLVAGLLASAALLPVLEMAPRGHRPLVKSPAGYQGFLGRSIGSDRLVTIAQPRFYGDPMHGTTNPARAVKAAVIAARAGAYWGLDHQDAIAPGDFAEFSLFCGLVPLLLALVAWRRRGPARLYGGLALLGLALALGLPLNRLLYFHFPGWAAGAGPCRLALWWCFGIAVSAGLGVDALPQSRPRGVWLAAAGLLAAHALAWVLAGPTLTKLAPLADVTQLGRLLGLLGVTAWLAAGTLVITRRPAWLPVLVAAELLAFGLGAVPTCPASRLDRTQVTAWLTRLGGIGPSDRVAVADSPRQWSFYFDPQGMMLPPNLATVAGVHDAGGYDSLMLADTKDRLSRLAGRQPITPLTNGNMLLLGNLRSLPEGTSRGLPNSPPGQPRTLGAIRVDRPNRMTVELPAGRHVVYDTSYPGWRLYGPDARPLAWHGALGRPREFVLTQPGLARFVFQPTTVRLGLFLALLGLAIVVGVGSSRTPLPHGQTP
ncbi:MAG: hypothetical protein HZB16_14900 [Armatimonadetes bacterium]|nr:hypothetical protein [Armatimonadota bacterium]